MLFYQRGRTFSCPCPPFSIHTYNDDEKKSARLDNKLSINGLFLNKHEYYNVLYQMKLTLKINIKWRILQYDIVIEVCFDARVFCASIKVKTCK